jgi:hypothetical protein
MIFYLKIILKIIYFIFYAKISEKSLYSTIILIIIMALQGYIKSHGNPVGC